jgi:chemotaxis protein CheD
MRTGDNSIREVYLKPGEVIISDKASSISTVLGSCVSVTMFSRQFNIGAICHNLLPACKDRHSCSGPCSESFRYVECTIERMAQEFSARGVDRRSIEVKLFGGSDMFNACGVRNSALSVGKQNVEMALRILNELGMKPVASDTGGKRGRKIIFHTHTGEVYLKRLSKTDIKECCNG